MQRTAFQTLDEILFSKYTLPSVGKDVHFPSADKTGIKMNCSTLLSKIGGKRLSFLSTTDRGPSFLVRKKDEDMNNKRVTHTV